MILFTARHQYSEDPKSYCSSFRRALEIEGPSEGYLFGIYWSHQYLPRDSSEWRSSHTDVTGIAIRWANAFKFWGPYHFYYNGPHCMFNLGPICIMYEKKHCKKCCPSCYSGEYCNE